MPFSAISGDDADIPEAGEEIRALRKRDGALGESQHFSMRRNLLSLRRQEFAPDTHKAPLPSGRPPKNKADKEVLKTGGANELETTVGG